MSRRLKRSADFGRRRSGSLAELEQLKVELLGKKGAITAQLKALSALDPAERKAAGARINAVRDGVAAALDSRRAELERAAARASDSPPIASTSRSRDAARLRAGCIRSPAHGDARSRSSERPGFTVEDGPEVEDDWHNFEALNIPANHPARAMHDTFYFPDGRLLRTHTSPVQIRAMLRDKPPLRMIVPGRVYRCDSDLTHTPMFHQIEGLVVDEGVSLANLKAVLHSFVERFFERQLGIRFRPSYFPFTEPSAEVDIECVFCNGQGCRVCKQTGWLEIAGSGVVHPKVLSERRHRPGALHGLRVRHGHRADRDAALRHQRPAPDVRERPALPAAVRLRRARCR